MAVNNDYITLLDPNTISDIDAAKKAVRELVSDIVKINTEIKGISGKLEVSGSFQANAANAKAADAALAKLAATVDKLVGAYTAFKAGQGTTRGATDDLARAQERLAKANAANAVEIAKVNEATRQQNLANKAAANAATAAAGSLAAMRAELRQMVTQYDNLSKAERENAAVGGALQKQIADTTAQLNAAEQATGRFGRNVGNYDGAVNGLRLQVTQIARELPSLSMGLSTFAMAIGNNFPLAQEAFARLREENKKLQAEGKPTQSVFKTLVGSILNIQTAVIVALAVLPALIKYFQQGSKAAQEAEKAQKKYADSLNSIEESSRNAAAQEQAHMQVLLAVAANVSASTKARTEAVKELQETYPSYFGNLSKEAILAGNVAEATERAARAIIAKSMAQAAEKKFAAAGEKVYDLQLAEEKAQAEYIARKKYAYRYEKEYLKRERVNTGSRFAVTPGSGDLATVKEQANQAQIELANIRQARLNALREQDKYLQDTLRFSQEAGDMLFEGKGNGGAPKNPKAEKAPFVPKDYTQELAAEYAKQSQIAADAQKAISESEDFTLQARINALRNWSSISQDAVTSRYEGEIDETRNSLAEIDRILQKDVSTRTDREKDLVGQIGVLNARLTRLIQEEANERVKIQADASERELKIVQEHYSKYAAAVKIANDYIAQFEAGGKAKKGNVQPLSDETIRDIQRAQQIGNDLASISSIQSSQRIAELNAEQEAVKARYDAEVEAIQNSLLSQQEKAEKTKLLREQQYQEELAIENQKRQERIEQAEFEKQLALANIAINTALAASKVLENPFQLALVLAAGIAQAAVVLATPIPQYKYGTDNHPGGPAIVGDGYVSEYAVTPTGELIRTPAKPTLMNLPEGTQVFPSAEAFARSQAADFGRMSKAFALTQHGSDSRNVEVAIEKQTRSIVRELKVNRPRPQRSQPDPFKYLKQQRRAKR